MNINIDKKIIAAISFFLILLTIFGIYYFSNSESNYEAIAISNEEETTTVIVENKFYIDIKGAVKKPGVYQVEEGMIVNDAIKMAGGLKSGAITSNINLSQKLVSEMVIYVFKKSDFTTKTSDEIKSDVTCSTNIIEVIEKTTNIVGSTNVNDSQTNLKININTASKEELMTLSNIGSSKADAIIIYRNENKFKTIEEIMNVAGIGESVYAKIKDNITV